MTNLNQPPRGTWKEYRLLLTSISWRRLVLLIATMILTALTEGISFLMLVPMLDTMNGPSLTPQPLSVRFGDVMFSLPLGLLLLLFVALVAARSVFQHIRGLAGIRLENEVVDALRLKCFSALMRAEWRLISRQRLSDYSSLIISNVDRIGFGLNQILSLAAMAVTGLACIGAAFVLSWKLSLFAIACGAAVLLAFRTQRRRALALGKEQNAAYEEVYAEVQEGLAGIRIAKVFRQEARHIEQVGAVFKTLRQHQISFVRSASWGRGALNIGGAALLALMIYIGLTVWHVPINNMLPLVLLFARLIPVMSGLQQGWENLLHAGPALTDTFTMLDEIDANSEPALGPNVAPLLLARSITLEQVGVTYADRSIPAVDNVTLTIPVCTTTVIMGPSGAGKSTLADVLMGLVVPDRGVLKVDGVPLVGMDRMRWRESVAYVQQDPFLFHASIRDNLLWAKPQADQAEIDRALRAASASFVHQLPEGLDTIVGDGGIRLSGGERQRIVLARALLCSPSLLILDEATSALDTENERAIRQAITDLHGALTVIVIGHRIAMVEAADQLVVMEGGRAAVTPQDVVAA
jgi:ATP-binding cassette, subfamily C, bacterial